MRKRDQQIDVSLMPKHVAIILDGNGRWAKKRGLTRSNGHEAGVRNIKNIALAANELGIKALSLFCFSTENWNRPQEEVDFLMKLPKKLEKLAKDDFEKFDIRVIVSGRKDRVNEENKELLEKVCEKTKERKGLILNICFDYGSKWEILEATKQIALLVKNGLDISDVDEKLFESYLTTNELPPLDILIRTSGEQRISNYLLWQVAYSELFFEKKNWPEFTKKDLEKIILDYQTRDRRFGGIKK